MGEGVQCRSQPFLFDQAGGLYESPFAVGWKLTLPEWKFFEWNSRPHDVDLVFSAAKIDYRTPQRFRSNKNAAHRVEHFFRRPAICWLLEIDQRVRPVKRNNAWISPCAKKREKMHRDVPKKNMQQLRVVLR